MSDTATVGGVDRGVPGLDVGADVAGVAMAGVDEAEVMVGSASERTRDFEGGLRTEAYASGVTVVVWREKKVGLQILIC